MLIIRASRIIYNNMTIINSYLLKDKVIQTIGANPNIEYPIIHFRSVCFEFTHICLACVPSITPSLNMCISFEH